MGAFLLMPAQAYVGRLLAMFEDYPPRQKAVSFSIERTLRKLHDQAQTDGW
jgi:hypothetical protein